MISVTHNRRLAERNEEFSLLLTIAITHDKLADISHKKIYIHLPHGPH